MLDQRQPQQEQTQHYLSTYGGARARQPVSSAALMWKPIERRGLTALGLNLDELARNEYLLRVRRLGFDYLKPAGVGRTMQAVLEDEAEEEEEEEVEEFGLDEDFGGANFAQDEGIIGEAVALEEGEEQDAEEEEEEEEVDLDDDVEEASEFDYDDDDEDEEDQAREEDPFMVDEEYDESTTTASAVNATNTSMSSTLGLPASDPHTPHPQQHRRYSRRSEAARMHSMGVSEDESRRRAAAIAEDLEPASSFTGGGELGLYQRTPPDASVVEYGTSDGEDARRAHIQQQQQHQRRQTSPSLGSLRYSSGASRDEEVSSGESEMEVD
ncbi:hypothetical protein D0Z00_000907 [Geotrichum galactomycetum]|uniref:Uncharacterized protein n=1 Tax=Geotrichum galactomycetum TaxID=27317 RepID=A0ACB6V8Q7_9ASCO|nr:hypothetical protein D0Z00_000907 [Geotrichum candidum]